jgi:hypothetical protein
MLFIPTKPASFFYSMEKSCILIISTFYLFFDGRKHGHLSKIDFMFSNSSQIFPYSIITAFGPQQKQRLSSTQSARTPGSVFVFFAKKCLSQAHQTIAIPTRFSTDIAGALNASDYLVDCEHGVVRPGPSR